MRKREMLDPHFSGDLPMRVRLLTLGYSASLGGFVDTALPDFVRDKEAPLALACPLPTAFRG